MKGYKLRENSQRRTFLRSAFREDFLGFAADDIKKNGGFLHTFIIKVSAHD